MKKKRGEGICDSNVGPAMQCIESEVKLVEYLEVEAFKKTTLQLYEMSSLYEWSVETPKSKEVN